MMNTKRLYEILALTTRQFRKGEVLEGTPHLVEQVKRGEAELTGNTELTGGGVLEIFAMPHEREAPPELEKVDVEFLVIGVDRRAALAHKEELIAILKDYPHPERLKAEASYIEVGAEIGDQGAAFQLFALGQVLGLWKLLTPALFGFTGEIARTLAGRGLVSITGFGATPA